MINLKIGSKEKHSISPYLYMQFMEPLGICDSSVDAAWDFVENDWYETVLDKVRELAPTMVRWGGCFASYYHWKEAIGPLAERVPMVNYHWGGLYNNQVGTHEIIDFCRRVNSEPLLVVNMESDGRTDWAYPKNGTCRFGTDVEAAEWVSYCNDPEHPLREKNGAKAPFNVKYWQIGNETSYSHGYDSDSSVEVTKRFVEKMRAADPNIKLIGWGEPNKKDDSWCRKIGKVDGIDLIAFHRHYGAGGPDSPLRGTEYRNDYEKSWEYLMNTHKEIQNSVDIMRADCNGKRLAMTESHFALTGRNRNEVLSSWGAGVAYARCHNTIMRNSDILDIATLADFFGTAWQVNALIIPNNLPQRAPLPGFKTRLPYLQPVGAVMGLFGAHQGKYDLDISYNGSIDAVASKTDDKIFIHIANTDMKSSQSIRLDISDKQIASARAFYIAANPETEITLDNTDCFAVSEADVEGDSFTLPAAAVAAIEITLKN